MYDASGLRVGTVVDIELNFVKGFSLIVSTQRRNLSRDSRELTIEANEITIVKDSILLQTTREGQRKRCPKCGYGNPMVARYCRECGTTLAAPRNDVAAGKGSLNISLANGINSVLAFALFALLPRMLTAVELGVLAAVTLSYTVFQVLGQLGLNLSAASLVSGALVEGVDAARRLLWGFVFLSISLSLVSTIPAYLLASTLAKLTVRELSATDAFQFGAIVVLANVLASNLEGVIQGIRDFNLLAKSRVVGQIVRIAISLVLLFSGYRVLAIIVGAFFGQYGLVTIAIQIPILLKRFRAVLPRVGDLIDVIRYSLPLYGVSLLSTITGNLDLAILVARATTAQVGAYSIVLTIVNTAALTIALPIQGSLIPLMSKILKEKGRLEETFKIGSRYLSLTAIPILFALASSSQLLMFAVAGSRYREDILPLAIAMFGLIATTFTALINASLQAHGKNTSMLVALGLSTVGEAVFGYWAIPLFGLVGAALTRVVQGLIWVGVELFLLRSVMRVRVEKPILGRMTLASCSFLIIPLHYFLWNSLLGLGTSCVVAAVVFLVSLKLLRPFAPADVQLILGIVPPILNPLAHVLRIQSLANWLTG